MQMVPMSPQTQPFAYYNACGMQSSVLCAPVSTFPPGIAPGPPSSQRQYYRKKNHKKKKKKKTKKKSDSDSSSDSDSDSSSHSDTKIEYVYVRKPGQQHSSKWSCFAAFKPVYSGMLYKLVLVNTEVHYMTA